MSRSVPRIAAALIVLSGLPGFGAVHFYSDRASWTQAVQNHQQVSLAGIAPAGGFLDFSTSAGATVAGLTFVAPTADLSGFNLAVVDPGFNPAVYNWGDGPVLRGSPPVGQTVKLAFGLMKLGLPSGSSAVGLDFMALNGKAQLFVFQLSTGQRFTIKSAAYPQPAFFGFTSDAAVSELDLGSSDQPLIANLSLGQAILPVVGNSRESGERRGKGAQPIIPGR